MILFYFIIIFAIVLYFFKKEKRIDIDVDVDNDIDVYLVSLEKDIERRNNVLSQINVDYVYAVDGNTLNLDTLEIENKNLKKGQIGCYLSHVHLLNKAIGNKNKILVLEDDAEITNDILKIEEIIKNAPEDFEILFLGYNYHENHDYESVSFVYGTHGYIINSQNITKEKIDKFFPISLPYDIALPRVLKSYIVIPKVIELNKTFMYTSNTQSIL